MRNKYAGCCSDCRKHVGIGEGYFQRSMGRWIVRCIACVTAGKIAKGKPLSFAQQEVSDDQ
jgi:hypothetical protein